MKGKNMNQVIMSGRIATDVACRETTNGTKVANYRIAVEKRYKKENQPTADFFNCVVFANGAEFAEKYLKKGMKIIINGELQNDNYQDKEGNMRYRDTILVRSHEFCESRSANGSSASVQETKPANDELVSLSDGMNEELPFN
jgi:single-strand DNA-binding protein